MSEKPDKTPGARASTPNDVPGPAPEAGLPGTAAEPPPELPSPHPRGAVASLENEKAELHDRMLRIAAEFDNWKKRSRKEMSDTETRSKEQVLREFLESSTTSNAPPLPGLTMAISIRAPCVMEWTWCCASSAASSNASR